MKSLALILPCAWLAEADCDTGSFQHNVTLYGTDPMETFQTSSVQKCCDACASSSDCGAWFHVKRSSGWDCDLFAVRDLESLKRGDCSKWPTPTSCASFFPDAPTPAPSPSPTSDVSVKVTLDQQWQISPYLSSMSLVYAWAPDRIYTQNQTTVNWAKQNRVATARYPAGMASYWNWENPTGRMGQSSFDPGWDGMVAPEEDWMSMGEYLDLCEATGMRPLIGANYNCHKSLWVNETESIARAVRQVKFAKSRGFPGGIWYIGNEDDAPQYADRIKKHALAMKEEDPTIQIFWNNNGMTPKNLKQFLAETGDVMDGAEFHGKWPYGGSPQLDPFTVTMWMDEVPLVEHKTKETWRQKIQGLRAAAREAGRPELLLANNEFGLGKAGAAFSDAGGAWTKYLKSMVAVEFALEMYVSGYDIAVFWDNHDGGDKSNRDQKLMDTQSDYRFNPMHFGFEMLARSTTASMLTMTTSLKSVHGFAAMTSQELLVYVLNKAGGAQTTTIMIDGISKVGAAQLSSMVDTEDHWGRLESSSGEYCQGGDGATTCTVTLPDMSFSLLRMSVLGATYV